MDVVYVINRKNGEIVEYDKYDFKTKFKNTYNNEGEYMEDLQHILTDEEFEKIPFIHETMCCFEIIKKGDKKFYREFHDQFLLRGGEHCAFPLVKVIEGNGKSQYFYRVCNIFDNMYIELKDSKTLHCALCPPNEKNVVYTINKNNQGEVFHIKYNFFPLENFLVAKCKPSPARFAK